MIKPYDLGDSLVEHTQRVEIDDLVRRARKGLKPRLLEAQIEASGLKVALTTSKTRFGGLRIWFLCPVCNSRRGIIYKIGEQIGCRLCLGLKYKKQRYKGMAELQNHLFI